jgi:hypothetical protein
LGKTLCIAAAVPAAPALAAVASLDPVLEQLLTNVAFVGVDRVVSQVQRLGVRVRLAVEVLGPGDVFFRLLESYVRVDVVWTAAAAAPASPATSVSVSAAATALIATALVATAALTATAATSISVLHSL